MTNPTRMLFMLTLGLGGKIMITADDDKDRSVYPTDVADLRRIPLAEVPQLSARTIDSALSRLVSRSPSEHVPVAAFNSAI